MNGIWKELKKPAKESYSNETVFWTWFWSINEGIFNGEPTLLVFLDVATKSQKDHKLFSTTYILCSKKFRN